MKKWFRHLKQGIKKFKESMLWLQISIVVIRHVHYINTLKQELNGTKDYKETSIDEKSVVYSNLNETHNNLAVDVKERQYRLPTMYWLPKLRKRQY